MMKSILLVAVVTLTAQAQAKNLSEMNCAELQKAAIATSQLHKTLYCEANNSTDYNEISKLGDRMQFEGKRLTFIMNLDSKKGCGLKFPLSEPCPDVAAKIKACQKAVDENDMAAYRKNCY